MDTIIWALPWVAMALIIVEFALVDELPASRVRRVMIGVGVLLLLLTALAEWWTPPLRVPHLLVASGPLAFLFLSELLRRAVLRLKGGEPVLLFTAGAGKGRSRRAFFEPDAPRRVSGWDHAYTLLTGVAMLLAALPAIGEIVQRSGGVPAGGAQSTAGGDPVVIFDLRPATRAPAIHGRVEVGHLSRLTWCPSTRRVVGAHQQPLTDTELSELRDLLTVPGLRRSPADSSEGMGEPVDLYTLRLGHPPVLVASGPWADAPAPLRDLRALFRAAVAGRSSPEVAGGAYLRSEALTSRGLRSLRRRGLVSIFEMDAVPEPARPALRRSMSRPHRFIAVDARVREDLLPLASHGHDLFVLDSGVAYQVELYSAEAGGGCPQDLPDPENSLDR